jgi:hypothetical protein
MRLRQASEQLFDIDENEYMPYAQSFSAVQPLKFTDPFDISLESIAEVGPGPFEHADIDGVSFDAAIDATRDAAPRTCSVCDNATNRLAVLKPCSHPLCSTCLTGALNIVGEKDMRCSVCNHAVDDFKLETFAGGIGASPTAATSTPPSARRTGLLPSAFDQSLDASFGAPAAPFSLFDGVQAASSPVGVRQMMNMAPGENIVLRIDNVPWVGCLFGSSRSTPSRLCRTSHLRRSPSGSSSPSSSSTCSSTARARRSATRTSSSQTRRSSRLLCAAPKTRFSARASGPAA